MLNLNDSKIQETRCCRELRKQVRDKYRTIEYNRR